MSIKGLAAKKVGVEKSMTKAVYIHIPFCKTICTYCAFCKFYYYEDIASSYLDTLKKEIEDNYTPEDIIETIYIGGGTPSDLSIVNLKKLLEIIKMFNKKEECEITFECNIDIEAEKLNLLHQNSINRLSFGIETINQKYLKTINRCQTKEEITAKIKLCRKLGFSNINGDLMYAFQEETIEDLKEDLDFLLSLDLEHISTYSLMIEPHTKLYLENYHSTQEETDAKMYEYIHKNLLKKGYQHYEVSNYSKEGYLSKHNMTYWQNKRYYGFGLGASGYLKNTRYTNTKSLNKYNKKNYIQEKETISQIEEMQYELILGLRTSKGVSLEEFKKKYQKNIEDIFDYDDLLQKKLLKIKDKVIYIPYNKWYVMNQILLRFLEVKK